MATRTDKLITIFEGQDKITPTQKRVGDGFDDTGKRAEKFGGAVKGATGSLVGLATQLGIVASVGGTIAFGAATIKAASDAEESLNAVGVVFGDATDSVVQFSEIAAEQVGLSATAFRELSTSTGALLKSTGIPMEEVADHTINLTKRAADLASVFNTDVDDAMSAINQALRGETEAIRKYTGDVTDATLEQYRLAQGMKQPVTEMNEQEKRLLRMQVLLDQTSFAQNDFSNTSEGAANQQRILAAQFENMKVEIGQRLLPIWDSLLGALGEILPIIADVITDGLDWLIDTVDNIATAVEDNWDTIKPFLIGFGTAIMVFIVPAFVSWAIAAGAAALATIAAAAPMILVIGAITLLVAAIVWLIENFDQVKETVSNVFNSIGEFIGNVISSIVDTIKGGIQSAIDFVVNGFNGFKDAVSGAFTSIKNGVSNVIDSIKNAITNFFSNIANVGNNIASVFKQLINTVVDKINDTLEFEIKILGRSISVNLPDIPRLQTGTNFFEGGPAIMNEVGPEMAILPRGTKIKSYDGNDVQTVGEGDGTTINNYNTFYERVDMNRVANKLAFQINQL
jgi:phage-related protein